jgi:hypothetical protein
MSLKHYFLLCLWAISAVSFAQKTSWRKSVKAAEAAIRESKYGEAAAHYEAAWNDKPSKTKYINQAGLYYALVRDYVKAADAYRNLRDDADFPLAQLQYARMLKQSGTYDKAAPEYADFISNYNGADADRLRDVVQMEIRGCEFAQMNLKNAAKNGIQTKRLGNTVNSVAADFAAVAFSDDLMYFSSNHSGRASIYRSQKQNGTWAGAVAPNGFPEYRNKDFCNGAFSPDGKRFYYTECVAAEDLNARCELYVMIRKGNNWSEPKRLPDDINAKGYTSTQPYVSEMADKEILYFASNKPGGKGGMDIWKTSRNIASDEFEFSVAQNLSEEINTPLDEITPFFDAAENALYFASNGHISMGGLDILKSKFSAQTNNWVKAENIGAPLNSNADDYYYVKNKTKTAGFFVSNRSGKERQHTLDEDIFEYILAPKNLTIKGQVLERSTSAVVKETRMNLYEILSNGQKRLLNTKVSNDGFYEFVLIADKKFRVEAEKKGFNTAMHEFVALKDSIAMGFEKNIYLNPTEKPSDLSFSEYIEDSKPKTNSPPATNAPKTNTSTPKVPDTKVATNNTPKNTNSPKGNLDNKIPNNTPTNNTPDILTAKGGSTSVGTMPLYETTSKDNERLITSAPKLDGTYYKIQMIAVKRFDMEENRYRLIKDLGRIDTEYIISKDMVRVLLADFFSIDDAKNALTQVRKNREFAGAYLIKYENGVRIGNAK